MILSKTPNISSLKNKKEIQDLLASGRKVYTKYGIIFLKNIPEAVNNKAAILVKKKCGNAVKRNYIKRVLRYFIREHARLLSNNNRIAFLYLYTGKAEYKKIETIYINALNRYEENSTNSH